MPLEISVREAGEIVIFDLSGPIVMGPEALALRDQVRDLLSKKRPRILLNLKGVDYIDSTGVGVLVGAYTSTRSRKGMFKLLNLSQKVQKTLLITRLLTVFEVYSDEQKALESF